ncbi:hypothetical protein QAD02_007605 [Eretmocerus hayati]|uniref:Uncharacterized protein n=1 Tax=Eretmocerus hayati TaxID=131215 RepID=A0ACC2N5D6_9HYME|nr:hypothetical protein QAD02_007605 [Eretmocerus hayati]
MRGKQKSKVSTWCRAYPTTRTRDSVARSRDIKPERWMAGGESAAQSLAVDTSTREDLGKFSKRRVHTIPHKMGDEPQRRKEWVHNPLIDKPRATSYRHSQLRDNAPDQGGRGVRNAPENALPQAQYHADNEPCQHPVVRNDNVPGNKEDQPPGVDNIDQADEILHWESTREIQRNKEVG